MSGYRACVVPDGDDAPEDDFRVDAGHARAAAYRTKMEAAPLDANIWARQHDDTVSIERVHVHYLLGFLSSVDRPDDETAEVVAALAASVADEGLT